MKKNLFVKSIISSLLLMLVIACDNEKLEGEFVDDNCFQRIADIREFRADVRGYDFRAEAEINPDNIFENFAIIFIQEDGTLTLDIDAFNVISATTSSESISIAISIVNPEVGVYDLATNNETGPAVVSQNEPFEHYGWFYEGTWPATSSWPEPYVTYIPNGGFGAAEITEFNEDEQYVSGNFTFTAKRIKTDPITEEPILDESGNEIIETIEVDCGNFNRLPFVIIDLTGNNQDSLNNEFFAKVDEVDFVPTSISATRIESDQDNVVIKIEAINNVGDLIRIDIPESLTEGTYDMVNLSDGTQLIGMYNPTQTASENLTSNPGTITITDINAYTGDIEAIFSFTGTDPIGIDPAVVQVTEGSFTVDYLPSIDINNVILATVNDDIFISNYTEVTTSVFNNITRYNYRSVDEGSSESIRLIVPSTITIGTHDISDVLITGEEVVAYWAGSGTSPNLIANSGTFTVIEHNEDTGLIEGVFEFLVIDTSVNPPLEYVVSNGEFSLFLQ
ncbi:MAG: hypothetical protein KUG68_00515 [Flavobacteriaceae bacterium]|nr:hypothetical protein [Flavobacteriaceae bacterium]